MIDADDILVSGNGPVAYALTALLAQAGLRVRCITAALPKTAREPRVVALSHASRELLEQLDAWAGLASTTISAVEVARAGARGLTRMRAQDAGVPALGHVVSYALLREHLRKHVAPLLIAGEYTGQVLRSDFLEASVEHPSGIHGTHRARMLVVADGGGRDAHETIYRSYAQTALLGRVRGEIAHHGCAFEMFTDSGPLALLPAEDDLDLVWCLPSARAAALIDTELSVLSEILSEAFGCRLGALQLLEAPLGFPLALMQRKSLTAPRTVFVGNAAQALHPVAGQGLNLGLRDARDLAQLARAGERDALGGARFLRAYVHRRRFDRSAIIGTTDVLARVFQTGPHGLGTLHGMALASLNACAPMRKWFARGMVFGFGHD